MGRTLVTASCPVAFSAWIPSSAENGRDPYGGGTARPEQPQMRLLVLWAEISYFLQGGGGIRGSGLAGRGQPDLELASGGPWRLAEQLVT